MNTEIAITIRLCSLFFLQLLAAKILSALQPFGAAQGGNGTRVFPVCLCFLGLMTIEPRIITLFVGKPLSDYVLDGKEDSFEMLSRENRGIETCKRSVPTPL